MAEGGEGRIAWYYRPWVVILLLFLVLGPFGLPLVYKSPKFSKTWKWVLTLLSVLYTWYLVVATIDAVKNISARIASLQAVWGGL